MTATTKTVLVKSGYLVTAQEMPLTVNGVDCLQYVNERGFQVALKDAKTLLDADPQPVVSVSVSTISVVSAEVGK